MFLGSRVDVDVVPCRGHVCVSDADRRGSWNGGAHGFGNRNDDADHCEIWNDADRRGNRNIPTNTCTFALAVAGHMRNCDALLCTSWT